MILKSIGTKHILHTVILVGIGVAGMKYLSGDEVLAALKAFRYVYLPLMLALSVVYMVVRAVRFGVLLRAVAPEVPWQLAIRLFWAGQPATLLPGGFAARAGLLQQVGIPLSRGAAPIMYDSALDYCIFLVGALGAALWYPQARLPALLMLCIIGIIGLLFTLPQSRHRLQQLARKLARRFQITADWKQFTQASRQIGSAPTLILALGLSLLPLVVIIPILDLSLRGIGVTVPYSTLFVAYIVPHMLARLFPIPGGVGITEAGMVGILATIPEMDHSFAASAVIIFRITTILWQSLLGSLVYFLSWRQEAEAAAVAPSLVPVESASNTRRMQQ